MSQLSGTKKTLQQSMLLPIFHHMYYLTTDPNTELSHQSEIAHVPFRLIAD